MSIDLKQWSGKNIAPIDDAVLYQHFDARSGIVFGCEPTAIGGLQIQITDGRGMICGREFEVVGETITVTGGNNVPGRLLIQIDASNVAAPISFVSQAADPLPALVQEDINRGGTIYQLPVATYTAGTAAISDLSAASNAISPLSDMIAAKEASGGHTANRVLTTNGSGSIATSSITTTKLGYISGLTSDAQTQLNGKQASLTFDNDPTRNSNNPVKSSGIFSALNRSRTDMSADHTLDAGDIGAILRGLTNSITLTIPVDASFASFPTGAQVFVMGWTAGKTVTVTPASGLKLYGADGVTGSKLIRPKCVACLMRVTTTEWLIFGQFENVG